MERNSIRLSRQPRVHYCPTLLELYLRHPPFGVVKRLDIFEHITTSLSGGTVNLPTDLLTFERLAEAFSNGIFVKVSSPTHAAHERVSLQERLPFAPVNGQP